MSNDLKDAALKAVNRKNRNDEILPDSNPHVNRFYKDYFSLDTGKPLPLNQIEKRIKRRIDEVERSSKFICLDLLFIYKNWKGFYSRTDSFSKYVNEELKLSRSHAYGIIHSVELLYQYYSQEGKSSYDLNSFMEEITSSFELIGVKKLVIISSIKNEEKKFEYVDRLLNGEKITAEVLMKREKEKKPTTKNIKIVNIEGDDFKKGEDVILTLKYQDEKLKKTVLAAVEKYFQKAI